MHNAYNHPQTELTARMKTIKYNLTAIMETEFQDQSWEVSIQGNLSGLKSGVTDLLIRDKINALVTGVLSLEDAESILVKIKEYEGKEAG